MVPLMRRAMLVPLLLLVAGGSLGVLAAGILEGASALISGALLVVISAAIVLLGVWRLANEAVRLLQIEVSRQVGGALSLHALTAAQTVPPLGDSSLSPAAAAQLLALVRARRPSTIVELGAGSSTVLLASAISCWGLGSQVHSIEHDARWVADVEQQVAGNRQVQVLHRPLTEMSDGTLWYSECPPAMPEGSIDLLIVDGPPDTVGAGHRSSALPVLYRCLATDAVIFVDDTDRETERRMVNTWLGAYTDLNVVIEGRDHVVLRRGPLERQ